MKKTRVHVLGGIVAAAVALCSYHARAEIIVGPAGSPIETFSSLPPFTNWATVTLPGSASTFNNPDTTGIPQMDAAILALGINNVTFVLSNSTATTPGTSSNGWWSSANTGFIQTRPTGNAGSLVAAKLYNNSGGNIAALGINYTLSTNNVAPPSEEIAGHRVYYSLTGAAGSFLPIGTYSNTGPVSINLDLSANPWAAASSMYLFFVDDNAVTGNDGSYQIDNFSISLPGIPPNIVTQPVGATNDEYSVVTLTVTASGSPPLTYQWKKNNTDIGGATGPTLFVTNTTGAGRTWSRPEDSGSYTVVVTGSAGSPATSLAANVLIRPDTNAPAILWAVVDTNRVRVMLSEPLINSLDDYGNISANLYWSVIKVSGPGSDIGAPDVDIQLVGNEVQLVYSALTIDPDTRYAVTYDGATLTDRAQTPNSTSHLESPLYVHESIILPMAQVWKYSDKDVAAPANWFTKNFDDSDGSFWLSGPGVLDGKRQAAQPWCRSVPLNSLTNPVGTCIILSNASALGATPTYYFRTHFNFSGNPAETALRLFGKFDDAAVVYLNGVEVERVGVPAGTYPHNQFISNLRSVGDGDAPDRSVLLVGTNLVTGDNVIAVDLRQVNSTSSDITMALQVTAATIGPVVTQAHLTVGTSGNQISIGWTPTGGSLLEATSVTGPWTTNGNANPTLITPSGGQKFFKVAQ